MIKINLLPVRQLRRRSRLRRQIGALGLCFVLLLAAIGVIASWQSKQISTLKSSIASLTAEKQTFDPLLKEIKALQEQKQAIESKIEVIKKLKETSMLTVRVLDQIAALTPQNRMWLTSITQSDVRLSILGVALDNATVAQFMTDLAISPWFDEAELVNTSLTDIAGQKLKSFSITIAITGPAAETAGKAVQPQSAEKPKG